MGETTVIFKDLRIRRDWQGNLEGKLDIQGEFASQTLNLTEELCAKILDVCADNIVEAARQVAEDFRREALQLTANPVEVLE